MMTAGSTLEFAFTFNYQVITSSVQFSKVYHKAIKQFHVPLYSDWFVWRN